MEHYKLVPSLFVSCNFGLFSHSRTFFYVSEALIYKLGFVPTLPRYTLDLFLGWAAFTDAMQFVTFARRTSKALQTLSKLSPRLLTVIATIGSIKPHSPGGVTRGKPWACAQPTGRSVCEFAWQQRDTDGTSFGWRKSST